MGWWTCCCGTLVSREHGMKSSRLTNLVQFRMQELQEPPSELLHHFGLQAHPGDGGQDAHGAQQVGPVSLRWCEILVFLLLQNVGFFHPPDHGRQRLVWGKQQQLRDREPLTPEQQHHLKFDFLNAPNKDKILDIQCKCSLYWAECPLLFLFYKSLTESASHSLILYCHLYFLVLFL